MASSRRKPYTLPRIAVLDLTPNDRIVVEMHERVSDDDADSIREGLAEILGIDGARVLVVYNATLKVLREGEPPPPRVILNPGRE